MPDELEQAAAPAVTVILTAGLTRLFPGSQARLELRAATVAAMLDELDNRWPGMRDRVRDSTPAIRRHMSVFVDGQRACLQTPLTPGGTVYILTAMSGG